MSIWRSGGLGSSTYLLSRYCSLGSCRELLASVFADAADCPLLGVVGPQIQLMRLAAYDKDGCMDADFGMKVAISLRKRSI